jgi:uncharacterized protein Smg (DUF494 family)
MNTKVIEIISLLVQKMLEGDLVLNEEQIVQELLEYGYETDDIEMAFELIFPGAEIIDEEDIFSSSYDKLSSYNRILTLAEKLYLPLNIEGLIRHLIFLNVLTPKQIETLILKAIQNSYIRKTGTKEIWNILEEILDDDSKLNMISQMIPAFKNIYQQNYKYIN